MITEKNNKKQTGFAWDFFKTPMQVCRGASTLYFNASFFCCHNFFEARIPQPTVSNQQNGKRCWLHLCSSKLASRTYWFIFLEIPLGFYLSPECLLNFLSNLYIPPWVGKNFKFMVLTILENALNLGIFIHAPLPTQNSPQVLINTP